ncbi:ABC transporter ATP-binding protein [Candidatus Raskinella chloraquaticus]|uniref:ABC transporter ATP-binding protein n=1 Tax=Candidatus Raskinella chloraquaticus TaxID=1951219 RepID=A0A1W9HUG5_9HYPH|nr:MAG: ABC transporter ATP-binding protein [Proteobacteria bacterium SG_bin8]
MTTVLEINDLQSFYGVSQVLYGLSLTVGAGEQIALLGRNGMGKTTLLKSIIGLVSDRRGAVNVMGQDAVHLPPEAIARLGIAYVPEGRGIFGSLSVLENLKMSARPDRAGRNHWSIDRIFAIFPRLAERQRHGGQQLSGGEQQMLSIGRALMTNPALILLDEATEGLAPLVVRDIWNSLAMMRAEGIATIIVDKDHRSLSRVADRMIMLAKGTIAFSGTPAELASRPDILERHLGV